MLSLLNDYTTMSPHILLTLSPSVKRGERPHKNSGFVNPNELQSRSTSSPPTLPKGTGIAILNQRSTSSRLASLPTNLVTQICRQI